jgi:hypothetical protein
MALSNADKKEIQRIISKEIKSFLSSTDMTKKVLEIIKKEMGGKEPEKRMVEIATKTIVELYKNLYMKRNFWEGALKNVKP